MIYCALICIYRRDVGFMAGMFDNSVVTKVQHANDIVELVSEYVSLKKKGREMVGICPFHDDHRPSMYVNGVKQIFKCFACGAGGDVFKFIQLRENLTFGQAIERLAERAGIKLEKSRSFRASAGKSKDDIDPNRLAKVNAWAAKSFRENLEDKQKGQSAREYLNERKITDESAKRWQIGLAVGDNDLVKKAKEIKASTELLIKAGLVTGQGDDKFVNRLMFPIVDVSGRIIGFGGRTLGRADAKYINSPTTVLFDKSNSMYGLNQARKEIISSEMGVVVEGYTDCIMAHQFGCRNVVATLGTSFTAGHGRILKRYAKKVVLVFDGDTAGVEAANRALEVCLSQHIDIKLASVPEGKDPCDFILTEGKERFEQLVSEASDVFEFKWSRLKESFASDETIAGKKAAIEEFLDTIAAGIRSGNMAVIDKGLVVNRLAKIIGLSTKEINAELDRRLRRKDTAQSYTVKNQKVVKTDLGEGLWAATQREILEVLLNEPKCFEFVKGKFTAEMFDVPILRVIAELLIEELSNGGEVTATGLLAKTESVEIGRSIVELSEAGEKKGNFQARLAGAMAVYERLEVARKIGKNKSTDDDADILRQICQNGIRENPHNVGMI